MLCEILTEDDQKVRSGCGLEEDWLNVVCLDTFGEAQGREAGRDAIQNVGFGISSFSLRFGCLRCRCMVQVFKYLQSLDVEDFKDVKSGYSITFVGFQQLQYCVKCCSDVSVFDMSSLCQWHDSLLCADIQTESVL